MTGQMPEPDPLPTLQDQLWLRCEATQRVMSLLEQAGFEARVVGGAVRNALLGKQVKDVDIATTAQPKQVLALAEEHSMKAIATGLAHGTVTVISGDTPYEITTLRKDVSTDGRHAVVAFTDDWVSDARRRDFTINAIYCDRRGVLFDPMNGYADIVHRQVRFVGDARQRIEEDYLRSLRFFRFFAEYGQGSPDRTAVNEITSCRAGLQQLSGERIRQELLKILVAPRAVEMIQVMHEYGLLPYILPVVPRPNHFARLSGCHTHSSAILRLAALAICTEEDCKRVSQRLKLSNSENDVLLHIAALRTPTQFSPSLELGRRWLYEHEAELYGARVRFLQTSSYRQIADPVWTTLLELPENWQPPTFPLSGRMAIDLGAEPGPAIGQLLAAIKTEWIDSDFNITDRELHKRLTERILIPHNNKS
ncbi:MAG: CCA tRNA nucleotidyltransferase [Pseudomonadota bacterium]